MSVSLLDLLDIGGKPLTLEGYFKRSYLENLFRSKIARSQATGKDGIRVPHFWHILAEEAALIERKVAESSYSFTTYKERLLLRGSKRPPRQISIPTVRDRLTLRAACYALHDNVPASIGQSPHALVKGVVSAIASSPPEGRSFVRLDVKDFFPSLSHKILSRELKRQKLSGVIHDICMKAVKTCTGEVEECAEKGIPQGLSISGALAAIYMLGFDAKFAKLPVSFFRYVDDILIICDTKEADEWLERTSRSLKARGLVAHPKGSIGKTVISPVKDGVDFLGYHICVDKISIRESSYRRMFRNLLKVTTDYYYRKDADRTLFRLNLKITGCIVDKKRRGWMMFFSHSENKQQLAHLDAFLTRQLSRVKFPQEKLKSVKRFLKSYHEIRHNLQNTAYIPNFDLYSLAEKQQAVATLGGRKLPEVLAMSVESLDLEFSKLISREVHDLEQDVGNLS